MRVKAYTIYDTKSLTYSNPFYAPTHGAAIRIVTDATQDNNSQLARHPADFILYCVGEFDDNSGIFMPIDPREHVIDVIACIPIQPTLWDNIATQAGAHPVKKETL